VVIRKFFLHPAIPAAARWRRLWRAAKRSSADWRTWT
jgi:hypothetical protein